MDGNVTENLQQNMKFDEDEMYEAQYFGFTPKSFSDGVYNAVSDFSQDLMTAVKNLLSSQYGKAMTEAEIDQATQDILNKMISTANNVTDKVESYLHSNVFRIPDNLILPEDAAHIGLENVGQAENMKIDDELSSLVKKIKQEKYVGEKLRQELLDIENVKSTYIQSLEHLKALTKIADDKGVTDWVQTLSFQRQKLSELLPMLKDLGSTDFTSWN